MTLTMHIDGVTHAAQTTENGRVVYTTTWNCPDCSTNGVYPANRRIEGDRGVYLCDAKCAGCGRDSGHVRIEVETLFGLEEDEAVLSFGRARVY